MSKLYQSKVWTGRKALSRSRWGNVDWEKRYSMTVGNKRRWREEKAYLSRAQKRMTMLHELEK